MSLSPLRPLLARYLAGEPTGTLFEALADVWRAAEGRFSADDADHESPLLMWGCRVLYDLFVDGTCELSATVLALLVRHDAWTLPEALHSLRLGGEGPRRGLFYFDGHLLSFVAGAGLARLPEYAADLESIARGRSELWVGLTEALVQSGDLERARWAFSLVDRPDCIAKALAILAPELGVEERATVVERSWQRMVAHGEPKMEYRIESLLDTVAIAAPEERAALLTRVEALLGDIDPGLYDAWQGYEDLRQLTAQACLDAGDVARALRWTRSIPEDDTLHTLPTLAPRFPAAERAELEATILRRLLVEPELSTSTLASIAAVSPSLAELCEHRILQEPDDDDRAVGCVEVAPHLPVDKTQSYLREAIASIASRAARRENKKLAVAVLDALDACHTRGVFPLTDSEIVRFLERATPFFSEYQAQRLARLAPPAWFEQLIAFFTRCAPEARDHGQYSNVLRALDTFFARLSPADADRHRALLRTLAEAIVRMPSHSGHLALRYLAPMSSEELLGIARSELLETRRRTVARLEKNLGEALAFVAKENPPTASDRSPLSRQPELVDQVKSEIRDALENGFRTTIPTIFDVSRRAVERGYVREVRDVLESLSAPSVRLRVRIVLVEHSTDEGVAEAGVTREGLRAELETDLEAFLDRGLVPRHYLFAYLEGRVSQRIERRAWAHAYSFALRAAELPFYGDRGGQLALPLSRLSDVVRPGSPIRRDMEDFHAAMRA